MDAIFFLSVLVQIWIKLDVQKIFSINYIYFVAIKKKKLRTLEIFQYLIVLLLISTHNNNFKIFVRNLYYEPIQYSQQFYDMYRQYFCHQFVLPTEFRVRQ